MTERFYFFIKNIFISLGQGGALILCTSIILILAVLNIFLAIFMRGYSLKKRAWYFVCTGTAVSFQTCSALFCGNNLGCSIFLLFLGLFLGIPILVVRERKTLSNEHKNFIKMIDGEILKQEKSDSLKVDFSEREKDLDLNFFSSEKQDDINSEKLKTYKCKQESLDKKEENKSELDFTHVKNVMEKMEYYKLSPTDKKQIKDLESAVYCAENGVFNQEIKNRINDGLGALLKIMAKHGV